ncbi:hypothetical protein [Bradyrhizobium erythrophlei]|uniref:Uncharacterized protein n=1 Tax=Bradyrhizobium erythrophlei TaxID=1437360 RepID=A0A1M5PNS3_9BRAD|nr:hypothetical protein [Bradyrhizobium erythrophlei]SHH03475.1 hypothetical protein SAMN05443248_3449 [Bradyrhizobium erythrophlei]
MRLKARVYVNLALEVIPLAKSAEDLRAWWDGERKRRDEYGLSESQIQQLIEACKEHLRSLGEQIRE